MRFRLAVRNRHPDHIPVLGSLVRVVDGVGEATPAQLEQLVRWGFALTVLDPDPPAPPAHVAEAAPAPTPPAPRKRARKATTA